MCKYPSETLLFILRGTHPEVELLGSYESSIFNFFKGNSILFSKVATPFYAPAKNAQVFQFLHVLSGTCFLFSDSSHPNGWKVTSRCGLNLCFPND